MAKIANVQEVDVDKLIPYENNAKQHGRDQIEKLKDSIKEFGFLTPCLIDQGYNLIAGHGRLIAAKELGLKTVPCVFIEGLTEEQRRAYILADNRLGELGDWDMALVNEELIDLQNLGFDTSIIGFDMDAIVDDLDDEEKYTPITNIPQYEPSGDVTFLEELCDSSRADWMIDEIKGADISESEKAFLIKAAARHFRFNYKKIADYYATASADMQRLMERSALVIIDYDNALANGYIRLSEKMEKVREGLET